MMVMMMMITMMADGRCNKLHKKHQRKRNNRNAAMKSAKQLNSYIASSLAQMIRKSCTTIGIDSSSREEEYRLIPSAISSFPISQVRNLRSES